MQRSATPSADADETPRDALTVLPLALPHTLTLRIWGALPCDVRLRCREVCPAWRDALAEPRLWSEVDLTETSGIVARVTPALLRAAAARAGGRLERLFVTHEHQLLQASLLQAALLAVFAANPDTLGLLRLQSLRLENRDYGWPFDEVEALLRGAPRQCVVEADVLGQHSTMLFGPMLRKEPPFQALHLRWLAVIGDDMRATAVTAFAAELATHPSLCKLTLLGSSLDTFAHAVVDAALTLRPTTLELYGCDVVPASAAALPRLLCGDALRELRMLGCGRNSTILDAAIAESLFGGLIGHASLTSITLWGGPNGDASATVGALFGALVAANSPLRALDVSNNALGDAGLGPLVDALPCNTRLLKLDCWRNGTSVAFISDRLMPALAANTSLQTLSSDSKEANDFIAARTAAMAAA